MYLFTTAQQQPGGLPYKSYVFIYNYFYQHLKLYQIINIIQQDYPTLQVHNNCQVVI